MSQPYKPKTTRNYNGAIISYRRKRRVIKPISKTNIPPADFLGIEKLTNYRYSLHHRILWFLGLLIAFTLTLWQVAICLTKFVDEPIRTEISVEIFTRYTIPPLTLCPTTRFLGFDFNESFLSNCEKDSVCKGLNETERQKYPFDKMNTSLEEMWLTKRVELNVEYQCAYAVNVTFCQEMAMTKVVHYNTTAGRCQMIANAKDIVWSYTGKSIWPVRLRTKDLPFEIDTSFHWSTNGENLYVGFQTLKQNTPNRLEMEITDFYFLNNSAKPCSTKDEEAKCENECFEKNVMKINPICKWPFLESNLPWCNTMQEIDHFRNQMVQVQKLVVECKCRRSCEFTYLKSSVTYYAKINRTVIGIVLASNAKQVVKEFYYYGFSSFLADLGGSIGIFLGISLLSLLNFLHSLLQKFL